MQNNPLCRDITAWVTPFKKPSSRSHCSLHAWIYVGKRGPNWRWTSQLCDCVSVYVSVCMYACPNAHVFVTVRACKGKKWLNLLLNWLLSFLLSSKSLSLFRTANCTLPSQWSDSILFCISLPLMCRCRVNPGHHQTSLSDILWFDWCGWVIFSTQIWIK